MRIAIVGCGRLGSELAMRLDADGHEITAIDPDAKALDRLGPFFGGEPIQGSGWSKEVLECCVAGGTDALVALTGSDNDNIVTALTAKRTFHVPKVVARIKDPRRAVIYRRLGVPTVAPTTWGSHKIRELILYPDFHTEHGFGNGEVEMIRVTIPSRLEGMQIGALTIPGQVEAVALTRMGEASIPTHATALVAGDVIRLVVSKEALPRMRELMELEA